MRNDGISAHSSHLHVLSVLSVSEVNRTGPYSSSLVSVGYLPFSSFVDKAMQVKLLNDLDAQLASTWSALPPANKFTYNIQRKWLDESGVAALELLIFPSLFFSRPLPKRPNSKAVFLSTDPESKPKTNTSYVTFGICPQHTFSRGSTHIVSNDGLAHPSINPKYFSWKFGQPHSQV